MINKIQVEINIDSSGKVLDVQSDGISIIEQFFTVEESMDWKVELANICKTLNKNCS